MFLKEFFNLEEKPGCNMTEEGRACPEHGIMECPGYKMIETSAQEKLHQQHQEIRKKSGLPDPNYYKELRATFDLPDAERQAAVATIKKKYKIKEQNVAGVSAGDNAAYASYADTRAKGDLLGKEMDPSRETGIKTITSPEYKSAVSNMTTGLAAQNPEMEKRYQMNKLTAPKPTYGASAAQLESEDLEEAGPFSYGAKKPRKGSVTDLAAKKRKEQERDKQPVEPRDHMVGVARVVKEGEDLSQYSTERLQAYVKKVSGGGVPAFGSGARLKRVQAELKRREQGVAEGLPPMGFVRSPQRHNPIKNPLRTFVEISNLLGITHNQLNALTKKYPGFPSPHAGIGKQVGRGKNNYYDLQQAKQWIKNNDIQNRIKSWSSNKEQGVAENVDIGREWMTDTEIDQYIPEPLQQEWRELLGYDENGNMSKYWAFKNEPDIHSDIGRVQILSAANLFFRMKKIPLTAYDFKDIDDELEWLVQVGPRQEVAVEGSGITKLNDYNQWLDQVDAQGAEKHMQKNQTLIVAQSWDGEKVGEFDIKRNQGWVMSPGISEGAGEKLLSKMIPGGASAFNALDAVRRYKSGDKVGAGIAAAGTIPITSIPAAAVDMARDKYYTGSFLPSDEQRDLANLNRQVADMEKQQWTKMPDGSERSPDGRTIRGPITKAPNEVTNEGIEQYLEELSRAGYEVITETAQLCPECGGPAFADQLLAEKQDACYHKVKSRYKVWPSAYASGALVRCRKKGAKNWGNKSKK